MPQTSVCVCALYFSFHLIHIFYKVGSGGTKSYDICRTLQLCALQMNERDSKHSIELATISNNIQVYVPMGNFIYVQYFQYAAIVSLL